MPAMTKFKLDDALGEALMSAFLSTRGLRPDLAGLKGFKPAISKRFLAVVKSPGLSRIELTDSGRRELAAKTRGLPLPMLEHIFSLIPDLSPAPWFDLREKADLAEAMKWVNSHWLHVDGLSGIGGKVPMVTGYWLDTGTGEHRHLSFRMPDGVSLPAILRKHGLAGTIADRWEAKLAPDKAFDGYPPSRPETRAAALALHAEANEEHRRRWRIAWGSQLDTAFHYDGIKTFIEALESDEIDVYTGVCETEPHEHCIRATGRSLDGIYWHDLNLALFMPSWDRKSGPVSLALVQAIVSAWPGLKRIHAASAEPARPAASFSMSLC